MKWAKLIYLVIKAVLAIAALLKHIWDHWPWDISWLLLSC